VIQTLPRRPRPAVWVWAMIHVGRMIEAAQRAASDIVLSTLSSTTRSTPSGHRSIWLLVNKRLRRGLCNGLNPEQVDPRHPSQKHDR